MKQTTCNFNYTTDLVDDFNSDYVFIAAIINRESALPYSYKFYLYTIRKKKLTKSNKNNFLINT